MRIRGNGSARRLGAPTAVIALTLTLAIPGVAHAGYPAAIGRANLDGTSVDQSFIEVQADALAADATHIYWVHRAADTIGRANADGTGVDEDFIDAEADDVTVDSAHIYWAHGDQIGRANLDGTSVDPDFIVDPDANGIGGVAVDASHVYWLHYEDIGRANLNGTGIDSEFISSFWISIGGIVADSTHLYWSYLDDFDPDAEPQARIGRANVDGTGFDRIFLSPTYVGGLGIDPAHLYWADGSQIGRANLDGSAVDYAFIDGAFDSVSVAADPAHVYWSNGARPAPKVGKAALHWHRGTATLPVRVPGAGELSLAGDGLRAVTKTVDSAGRESLRVKPKGRKKRTLKRRGKVTVKPEVTFELTGSGTRTRSERLRLIYRPHAGPYDARAGKYIGSTGSDPVGFTVTKDHEVKGPFFTLIVGSTSSCLTDFHIRGRDKISPEGRFVIEGRHATFSGEFVSRKRVSGHAYGEARGCGSTTDRYTAHRR
jgi:hypothetical protein